MRSTKSVIRTMSNKNLLYQANRFRKERNEPEKYGRGGTSRYVTSSEFWGRSGKKEIMAEIARRRKAGKLRHDAGRAKRRNSGYSLNPFGLRF